MAGQGTLVVATDYNTIQGKVQAVLGTGGTNPTTGVADSSFGYGQTLLSGSVSANSKITVSQWNNLRTDLVKARQHQTGITVGSRESTDPLFVAGQDLKIPTTTNKITETDRASFNQMADYIVSDRLLTVSTQVSKDVMSNLTYSTNWSDILSHTVSLTFSSIDQIRYFVNTGGYLEISASESITGTDDKNTSWKTIFTGIGTISIKSSSTTSTGSGVGSAIGLLNLTTSDQIVYQKTGPSYSPNQYRVYARKDSAGTTVTITIQFADLNSQPNIPWGTDEPIIGSITSTVNSVRASGTNVSILSPIVSSASIGGAPTNTAVPVITGSLLVASVLTCSTGTWTGPGTITYTYQWYRNTGAALGTGSTYTVQNGDNATSIYCAVTASNAYGSSTKTSILVGPINKIPTNTVAPVITGTATAGSTLTCSPGTWNGTGTITYSYEWRRNNGVLVRYGQTYVVQIIDKTYSLYCTVVASNTYGTATASSNSLGPVP